MTPTKTEFKILLQLHLQGYWGKSGNLTKKQRLAYLVDLTDRGYLNKCRLTSKAIAFLDSKHNSQ